MFADGCIDSITPFMSPTYSSFRPKSVINVIIDMDEKKMPKVESDPPARFALGLAWRAGSA
jgi:hypothetical protein